MWIQCMVCEICSIEILHFIQGTICLRKWINYHKRFHALWKSDYIWDPMECTTTSISPKLIPWHVFMLHHEIEVKHTLKRNAQEVNHCWVLFKYAYHWLESWVSMIFGLMKDLVLSQLISQVSWTLSIKFSYYWKR